MSDVLVDLLVFSAANLVPLIAIVALVFLLALVMAIGDQVQELVLAPWRRQELWQKAKRSAEAVAPARGAPEGPPKHPSPQRPGRVGRSGREAGVAQRPGP